MSHYSLIYVTAPNFFSYRFWDDHVDHNSPVLHGPSARSYQTLVPYQPGAATHQPLAVTNQPLTGTHHPSARTQYSPPRSHVSDPQSFESRDSNIRGLGTSENFMQLRNNAMGHTAEHHHLVKDNNPFLHGQENKHARDIL